jgi:hypothetical protein
MTCSLRNLLACTSAHDGEEEDLVGFYDPSPSFPLWGTHGVVLARLNAEGQPFRLDTHIYSGTENGFFSIHLLALPGITACDETGSFKHNALNKIPKPTKVCVSQSQQSLELAVSRDYCYRDPLARGARCRFHDSW